MVSRRWGLHRRKNARRLGQIAAVSLSSVTVVIPTFNSAATIKRALDTVFAQTALPSRVIVVDNASSDA
ncbi:MAG: glycosyltransferase family 2 protein, partial [Acidimicrobiia bacterium]